VRGVSKRGEFSLLTERDKNCRCMSFYDLLLDGTKLDSLATASEWETRDLPQFSEQSKLCIGGPLRVSARARELTFVRQTGGKSGCG
jgi:hypothetical protein